MPSAVCTYIQLLQTLQVQLLERLELPDLLADGEELVVAQGQHAQLLEAPDGRGDAAQLVVGQIQGLKKYETLIELFCMRLSELRIRNFLAWRVPMLNRASGIESSVRRLYDKS